MHLHSADTAPQSPHRTTAAITADFAATWPAVELPLRRYLGSIGVNRHDIDDLVQETASRAIRSQVPYDDASDLRAWSFVVARRLLANLHRSRKRQVEYDGAQRPDPGQEDLMTQVEDRLVIEKVIASATMLTVTERRHLGGRSAGTAAERNRAAVARHRARQHLRKLVGPLVVTAVFMRRRGLLATAGIGVAAVALPLALLPSLDNVQANGPTSQHAVARPVAAASTFNESSQPRVWAAPRHLRRAVVERRTASTTRLIVAPSLNASGPAGTKTHAAVEPNDGKQPLVCTTGTIIKRKCVDLPPGIGSRQAAYTRPQRTSATTQL